MANADPFAKLREEGRQTLEAVLEDIERRKAELNALRVQADRWQAAIARAELDPARALAARNRATSRRRAKRAKGTHPKTT